MNDEFKARIKTPAIGLIVTGILNAAFGFVGLFSGLIRLTGLIPGDKLPTDEAERMGFLVGTAAGYAVCFFSIAAAPLIIIGGRKMLNGSNRRYALAAAVFAFFPLTSCCFIPGSIFGIWALVILTRPDVKVYFISNQEY